MAARQLRKKRKVTQTHSPRYVAIFTISIVLIVLMLWQILSALTYQTEARRNNKLCRGKSGSFFSICTVGGTACADGCSCQPFKDGFNVGICRTNGGPQPSIKPCRNENGNNNKGGNNGNNAENEKEGSNDANLVMFAGKNGNKNVINQKNKIGGKENDKEGSWSAKPCNPNPSTSPPAGGGNGGGGNGGAGTIACGKSCTKDGDCASGFCNPSGFAICPTSAPGQPIEQCHFLPPDPTAPSVCAPMTCKADNTNPANCACPAGGALRLR